MPYRIYIFYHYFSVTTGTYYKGELKAYKNEYILCDYLETDEAFENWLNEKCNARNKIII